MILKMILKMKTANGDKNKEPRQAEVLLMRGEIVSFNYLQQ